MEKTLVDPPKYQGWRHQMVKRLREMGITDERVLQAMDSLPRNWFVDDTVYDYALYDPEAALRISREQTISKPITVAWQSELLQVGDFMKVLEVGTGSGYQTAVLCRMGARVFTVERQVALFRRTKALLAQMHMDARCYLGDSFEGIPELTGFVFDRVLVTCGAPQIPEGLMRVLKVGGVMVVPVGNETQRMLRVTKEGEMPSEWRVEDLGDARFVPMLRGTQH